MQVLEKCSWTCRSVLLNSGPEAFVTIRICCKKFLAL